MNTKRLNFLKIKNSFLRICNRGFSKISSKLLANNPIQREIFHNKSKGVTEVVSNEEGDMVSMLALDNLDGRLLKGRSTALFPSLLSTMTKQSLTI